MVEVPSTPPSERYPGRPPEGRVVVIIAQQQQGTKRNTLYRGWYG